MPCYVQLVIGPAASGKSRYCQTMQEHFSALKRPLTIVNLDPAAEYFAYTPNFDIRELVTSEDVMETLDLGPNAALIQAIEYLITESEWIDDIVEDDAYIIFDCPGQIELYTHLDLMVNFIAKLKTLGCHVCSVYTMDAMLLLDVSKYVTSLMIATSVMVRLETPHVTILTKYDLLPNKDELDIEDYFSFERFAHSQGQLTEFDLAIEELVDEYNMVGMTPLDITDEDTIDVVLTTIDNALQWGEEEEPKDSKFLDSQEAPDDDLGGFADIGVDLGHSTELQETYLDNIDE